MSWDSRFAEPIELPDGIKLATLRESIAHLIKTIPAAERRLPAVLTAAEMLTAAAEHRGAIEFARRVFNSDRKETHWGRHKPKQDTT